MFLSICFLCNNGRLSGCRDAAIKLPIKNSEMDYYYAHEKCFKNMMTPSSVDILRENTVEQTLTQKIIDLVNSKIILSRSEIYSFFSNQDQKSIQVLLHRLVKGCQFSIHIRLTSGSFPIHFRSCSFPAYFQFISVNFGSFLLHF